MPSQAVSLYDTESIWRNSVIDHCEIPSLRLRQFKVVVLDDLSGGSVANLKGDCEVQV